ncbi:hypothetical protein RJ639_002105 [Escallonia herrerae]|uniref:Condensation domain-containing protein n=1 Tax=Escallonia herrerae TaxID=1293975 RepID=A0AA88XC89_9ASTE|nr:hypothetical protein RJ639_002105 [Escallonia herrerae]
MAEEQHNQIKLELKDRSLGGTEHNWCRAVSSGTGITVLAVQVSKEPDSLALQDALHKIQNAHPILRSKLHKNTPNTTTTTGTFSFITPSKPHLQLKSFYFSNPSNTSISPLQAILEQELNNKVWSDHNRFPGTGADVFFASLYTVPGEKWVLVLRLHAAACDRTTAVSLLKELMVLMGENEGEVTKRETGNKGEVSLGIEDLIPNGKAKKTLWAHGVDMLGYSVNSLRLTNLKFKDVKWPRCSEVVRLHMNSHDTQMILAGCKSRGIKLCGVLAAAGLIAAHSSKYRPDHHLKKYGVVTLMDCRFYHSAILNIHQVKGGDELWEVAKRSYMAFKNSKDNNKHFSDMADLNFLMCKAINNPGLTASSSLRASLLTVFEDPVIDNTNETQRNLGLDDYMGCASVHGVGPSIGIFDTIRDGELDCVCVYPSPLHSREQMLELVDKMKMVLVEGGNCGKSEN